MKKEELKRHLTKCSEKIPCPTEFQLLNTSSTDKLTQEICNSKNMPSRGLSRIQEVMFT